MEQFDISEDTPTLLDDLFDDGQEGADKDKAGPAIKVEPIGYRWVAGRGKNACPKCAALHNKVFYFEPGPGQASVDNMPKGQLHPDCSCTTKPVAKTSFFRRYDPTIRPYMEGKVEHGRSGALFRKDSLNSSGKMPIYGRYGGDYWTGGRDTSHDNEPDPHAYDAPGEDDLDEIFKNHDLCYDVNGRDNLECDRTLLQELNSLDPDPRNWSNPPDNEDDIKYAEDYRMMAIFIFYWRVREGDLDDVIIDDIEQGRAPAV